ncbi:PREDICTED: ATP-binding cassette sub-family B member 6, mitochondrial [Wasmannia auropunctata]|uniref:ATP-binding cassette sub-family B member 6, mitochondrial n=2 Tax=Wasmannia auropunctata TaxID=64793 RepID=UPI0005F01CAF|nr:PREDICTED: ATP-binding cassette sub-family B member 6, mitochondrial [Wasmannia auropunctata]XP_011705032.1 PREDICTED: ATP-binding cassette sub-family B member 6, mitochondrial [Wasmannia auropunctata]XP_011705033.1 PREDICTED: ATP-binding cassette sub-family B member 6, mitochondrial [Wasmannia auropunctata]XP_011705034.1 PREDICTED: ATP-binding cassette sub-family B member 6, mitochondrial [Wasmannia auropunctata]XP_011705036.1 PREDICTED: ATP-binding cassette sub-family B member 6, mitochond
MSINMDTMRYCPPNITFSDIWIDHGVSKCFMDTICISIISLYLIIFGSVQLWIYRKYATETENTLPRSKLYNLQKFVLYLVPILSVVRIILQATVLDDGMVYGYMVLTTVLTVIVYPYSIYILKIERHKLLPSVPPHGHGLVLLGFWTLAFVAENLVLINIGKLEWWFHLNSLTDQIEMALFILRYVSNLLIFALGLRAPGIGGNFDSDYRTLNDTIIRSRYYQRRSDNASTWTNLWYKTKTLAPFLWPKSDFLLQLRVIFCFMLLLCGRLINLYVPIYNKKIVDSVTIVPVEFRWDIVLIYVAFKFLQGGGTGGMGVLNNLRSFLWIRIQQYTTREVEIELFRHLHGLSLRWHLGRKTGEVLRIMDRGTDSINNLLNYILFSIVPTIIDILVAVLFFITAFNKWFGLIVFTTMVLYIAATIAITEWRTKFQRRMNLADNAQKARSVDSLLNFETVKYYGAEAYEVECYRKAILDFQVQEWKSMITLNILNTLQNIIVCGGLLSGSLLCLHMVVAHQGLTIGDYVLFASYIIQLYVPLNWFGTYYRAIQKNFVDMENMFELLREEQEVIDAPGAELLDVKHGHVVFSNVSFGYTPEKLVLKNVSFIVPAGKTVALVGPSGAGKSTIMRLLFRFYDVEQGAILIDGQNVKTVKQESLRSNIGVVPQDTVLFNNTIRYNIQYGRIDAPEADVIAAAKYADIHERILTFPNGYETQVGERGLRLSGGEKQRVAIARTILKAPKIVLLDEATSALDTQTERNIQAALNRVCAGRTTIIVAHRLSTIIHADEILVLKDGEIIERGKHEELISSNSTVYHAMWQAQLQNNQEDNKNENNSVYETDVLISNKSE